MKVNKRNIAAVLRESVFSPTEDRLMKVIVDVGGTSYYISRALEEIWKAAGDQDKLNEHLKMAISLLALARINSSD